MENNEQELMFKLSMFEQQIQQLQQQIQAVEQGLVEMESLNLGLSELVGSAGKEILATIGRGIFVEAKLVSEDLTVDIGEKKFVKKSISKTKELIEEQIEKLKEVKKELEKNLEKVSEELQRVMEEEQKKNKR
jgi:prefoldin alpha subunit